MPDRFRRRLSLATVATLLLIGIGSIVVVRAAVRERAVERLRAEAALVAEWVGQGIPELEFQDLAVRSATRLGNRVTLIDGNGVVVADSAMDADGVSVMENHLQRPEIQAARLRGFGESARRSDTTNVEYHYSASRVAGTGPVTYVRIALPASALSSLGARYVWVVLLLNLGTALLLGGIWIVAHRRQTRAASELALAIRTSGDAPASFREVTPPGGVLELVSDAAESLHTRQLERIDNLETERAVMASVVAGMREGLLLIDTDRTVRLANAAMVRILEIDFDPRGHSLLELFRNPSLLQEIETTLDGNSASSNSTLEIAATDRVFQIQISPLRSVEHGPIEGALALFFDITRLEKLEGLRREFVANVSHELRTPLTSIRASAENLLDGAANDGNMARKFTEIIARHADRMRELIEDLTDLSLIETGNTTVELVELDASEVVREVTEHVAALAESDGVEIIDEVPVPFPLHADRRRLWQMLRNLVENAIKFNRSGGTVWLRAEADSSGRRIRVVDNGEGIPAASLDKVFNRFYQVGQDRSGRQRGTGLGLAITKHLMRLHDGRVRVTSELGQGSTFELEFPERSR